MSEGLPNNNTQISNETQENMSERDAARVDVDIDDPYAVTSREIEALENFVDSYPFPSCFSELESNSEIALKLGLGLGFEGELQELNQASTPVIIGNNVIEGTNNSSDSPNHLQFEDSLPDHSAQYSNNHGNGQQGRATDLLMSVSLSTDLYRDMIYDHAARAMEQLLELANQEEFNPPTTQNSEQRLNAAREANGMTNRQDQMVHHPELLSLGLSTASEAGSSLSGEAVNGTLQVEASREIAFLAIDRIGLIDLLMDPQLLVNQFPDIVTRSTVISVLSAGSADYDGTLQVMMAEFHMPTPLVSARESYFARYSKKLSADTWGVVDISIESLFPYPAIRYQRRPSGCIIREFPNGYSKVTWVEHVEVDNSRVDIIFRPVVSLAFGAKRWLSAIARQSDWLETPMNISSSMYGVHPMYQKAIQVTQPGARSLLKVGEKMMVMFCSNASSSTSNVWTSVPMNAVESMRISQKTLVSDDPEIPSRRTVVLATTVMIPIFPKLLFDFLSDSQSRPKWDLLSKNNTIREYARIKIGKRLDHHVTVLHVKDDSGNTTMSYLQRSYTDSICSYVVYAPIDVPTMNRLLDGGDPRDVAVLPSGFVVFPDSPSMNGEDTNSGSLLTVVFHVMDLLPKDDQDSNISSTSIETAQKIISGTVDQIKASFLRNRRRRRENSG